MKNKNPKVSVLMATWNRAAYIGQAIQSVLEQTFKDWELIVVDDGSTDNTPSVVAGWMKKDKRIKYVKLSHIGRIAIVSNAGLRETSGEYIAILDDDDWWPDKEKLKKQIDFLDKNKDYVGCGGGFIVVDGEGKKKSRILKPESDGSIRKTALCANPVANSSTVFRKSAAAKIGFYDETMTQFADWDFWLRIGKLGKLYNFPEYFLCYRMWEEGSSFTHQKQNADSAARIVKRYKNDYPGFLKALCLAYLYQAYARLPVFIRRALNSSLSLLKKLIFSR